MTSRFANDMHGTTPTRTAGEIQGWHVLTALLAFFGTIVAVNAIFIVTAIETNTGLVAVEPYRKGLHYNDRIAFDARQSALGWRHAMTLDPTSGNLTLSVDDKAGTPKSGLAVTGTIGRPATNAEDQALSFSEVSPGQYVAAIRALEPGGYITMIEVAPSAAEDQKPVFRVKERLWVKP
ncbi:MAG: FixH family protein [Hyphomicrobium sp.]|nr:FixH family protein [Hyphomicrobium sp.]